MATLPRIKDRPFSPDRITIWKNGNEWEVCIPEEFAADPADALVGWDPEWSVYAGDYDADGPFHMSYFDVFEHVREFFTCITQETRFGNPRTSPIRRRYSH